MQVILNQVLDSFVKINAVLSLHQEVLQKVIEYLHFLFLLFHVLELLFKKYLFVLQNVLQEVRDFQVLFDEILLSVLSGWLVGSHLLDLLCALLHVIFDDKFVVLHQILNAILQLSEYFH